MSHDDEDYDGNRRVTSRRDESGGRRVNNGDDPGVFDISAFGVHIKARGRDVAFIVMIFGVTFMLALFLYIHNEDMNKDNIASQASHKLLSQQINEMIFVISRPQEEREKMNIAMPDSLRARTRGSNHRRIEEEGNP